MAKASQAVTATPREQTIELIGDMLSKAYDRASIARAILTLMENDKEKCDAEKECRMKVLVSHLESLTAEIVDAARTGYPALMNLKQLTADAAVQSK